MWSSRNKNNTRQRVIVITDAHFFDNDQLLINDGTAFEEAKEVNNVLPYYSKQILDAHFRQIESLRPDWMLLTGDFAFSGEKVNHIEFYSRYLKPLLDKGVKMFVCPGNHDIDDPFASAFDGDISIPVEKLTAQDFKYIYAKCGFDAAFSKDVNSLSYAARPGDGFGLISIDACHYSDDRPNKLHGSVRASTILWMRKQVALLKAEGREVFALVHHPIINHFDRQNELISGIVLDNSDEFATALVNMGVKFVFTGHFHAQDIAQWGNEKLFDINTGSLVSSDCFFRVIDLDTETGEMIVSSQKLNASDAPIANFKEYAYTVAGQWSNYFIGMLAISPAVDNSVRQQVVEYGKEAFLAHFLGDESLSDEKRQELICYASKYPEVSSVIDSFIINGLYTNLDPQDNALKFNYIAGTIIPFH